jgi:hypothetical protein
MCEIVVKCTKCEKFVSSVTSKIRRLGKSVRKLSDGKKKSEINRDQIIKLSAEIEGLEWGLRMIKKHCECDIRSWREKNGY